MKPLLVSKSLPVAVRDSKTSRKALQEATSFPVSLSLPAPLSQAEERNPGNEVAY